MNNKLQHLLLLKWLIFTGFIVFAIIISYEHGVLLTLYTVDKSYISWLISLLYIIVSIHCAIRAYSISKENSLSHYINDMFNSTDNIILSLKDKHIITNTGINLPKCILTSYIHDIFVSQTNEFENNLVNVYESQLHRQQAIGWFIADVILKLGLLGTIVGFIYMLGSIKNITDFDVNNMQQILQHMSSGMATALYTTLVGLICSILAAIQYQMIEQSIDEIIETMQHISHVHIIPKLNS